MIVLSKKGIEEIINNADGTATVKCTIEAGTSAEVIASGADGSTIEGLNAGDKLAPFSKCFTASAELGVLGSDGVWKF